MLMLTHTPEISMAFRPRVHAWHFDQACMHGVHWRASCMAFIGVRACVAFIGLRACMAVRAE